EDQLREWVVTAAKWAYERGGQLQWIEQLIGVDRNPNFVLWGKTDAAIVGGDLVPIEVVDWTFGRQRFDRPEQFRQSLPARIHRLCAGHAAPDRSARPIAVTEMHVPSGTSMTVVHTDEDVRSAWGDMKRYAAEIAAARA